MSNVLHNVPMRSDAREVSYSQVVKVCNQDQLEKTDKQCSDVCTRLFYNSKVSRRNVESLLAKGNKVKSLKHGTVPYGKRTKIGGVTKPKCAHGVTSKNYNQTVTPKIHTTVPSMATNRVQEGGSINRGSENFVAPVTNNHVHGSPITAGCKTKGDASDKELIGGVNTSSEQVDVLKHDKVIVFNINGSDEKFLNVTGKKRFEELLLCKEDTDIKIFNEWRHQSDFDFGFVPFSDFVMPSVHESFSDCVIDPFDLHKRIKDSGKLNFLGCRIPLTSQLKLQAWQEMLVGYWDVQLIHLLTFGFPLVYNRNYTLHSDKGNHSSTVQYPEHVDAYLEEETDHGAILGPFAKNSIKKCHYSPFLTREKSGSDKRRVIIDLSWPRGFSVNAGIDKNSYLGTDFALTFPSVDHITTELTRLGTAAHLYKIDVSRAFRHVKLDPSDYDLLGLSWNDVTCMDTCLPFGGRHGTQIFQRISDAIRFGMRQKGYTVINYVDDFVRVGTPSVASASYQCLLELLRRLGLDISQKSYVHPVLRLYAWASRLIPYVALFPSLTKNCDTYAKWWMNGVTSVSVLYVSCSHC